MNENNKKSERDSEVTRSGNGEMMPISGSRDFETSLGFYKKMAYLLLVAVAGWMVYSALIGREMSGIEYFIVAVLAFHLVSGGSLAWLSGLSSDASTTDTGNDEMMNKRPQCHERKM